VPSGSVERGALTWQRWGATVVEWFPYGSLAVAWVLAIALENVEWTSFVETSVLVVLAAGWVYALYTRAPRPRTAQRGRMIVYFAGLVTLAGVLLARHPVFVVFAITAYLHSALLRPWPLTILGVGVLSLLVNIIPTGFPQSTPDIGTVFVLTTIQTLSIGFGTVMGERVAELSEQRRQVVTQLETALVENAGLHAQLLAQAREAGVLDERQRMAREIHDTLAQGLIGIITQLEAMSQMQAHPTEWRRHLDNAARLARVSLSEARRSVEASRPGALEKTRLPGALAAVVEEWSALHTVAVQVTTVGDAQPLHAEVEAALLRTTQEALANVAKHAKASRVGVTLSYMGDVVTLDVRDDGVGFEVPDSAAGAGTGFGLTAMRQRVSRVAGTLAVESEPGGGTAISARVPAILAERGGGTA
jgi:signal transduction histidine kinase